MCIFYQNYQILMVFKMIIFSQFLQWKSEGLFNKLISNLSWFLFFSFYSMWTWKISFCVWFYLYFSTLMTTYSKINWFIFIESSFAFKNNKKNIVVLMFATSIGRTQSDFFISNICRLFCVCLSGLSIVWTGFHL